MPKKSEIPRPVRGCDVDASDIYAPGDGWIASVQHEFRADVIQSVNLFPRAVELLRRWSAHPSRPSIDDLIAATELLAEIDGIFERKEAE